MPTTCQACIRYLYTPRIPVFHKHVIQTLLQVVGSKHPHLREGEFRLEYQEWLGCGMQSQAKRFLVEKMRKNLAYGRCPKASVIREW